MGVKVVKEITSGTSATQAIEAASGGGGGTGIRVQRVWKIVYDEPADRWGPTDIRALAGVYVGAPHPLASFMVCDLLEMKPEGDSRHVYTLTANYTSKPLSVVDGGVNDNNQDPRSQEPSTRKSNWSTEVSAIEAPAWTWRPVFRSGIGDVNLGWGPAVNPAGDMYDGVVTMQPIVVIKVEQLQQRDPNEWALYVGCVNRTEGRFGALKCAPRSVMLKGISATPHFEQYDSSYWRGWKANYEFVYKPGWNGYLKRYLGWDVAVPVTGWNVKNIAGAIADNTVDKGALALKLTNDSVGSIAGWEGGEAIEPKLVGKKSRANVLIAAPNAQAAQRPSAQPVALNWNGTPRNLDPNRAGGVLEPLIQVNQIYPDVEFAGIGLRIT